MNDFSQLPSARREVAPVHVGAGFLAQPHPASHTVQFYDDELFLCETVARFARSGLDAGERVLLVVTAEHARGILGQLDPERVGLALREGQISVVDARTLLGSLLVDDLPDEQRFRAALAPLLADAAPGPTLTAMPAAVRAARPVRVFGEMVDVLWRDGNTRAALRLEELWGELLREQPIVLLCAYASANFRGNSDGAGFAEVCGLHTHAMPTEGFAQLSDPAAQLREISVLQQRARALEGEVRQRKASESALREVLERRAQVEAELRVSLEREQEARLQAQANDAFKEMFLGILGHDLRNPLNTILTTARLMTLRGELLPDSQKRIDRVIASGVRMQRMIEQILDMARDRLTTGIAVSRSAPRDLLPLVAKIVEETRLAHPERRIELRSEGHCVASIDADRFEQVVSNLLGNAATHGDPARPIVVRLAEVDERAPTSAVDASAVSDAADSPPVAGAKVSFSVRNHGVPIDPEFLPLLFDPFRRQRKPEGRSAGLGLGLYISERIVRAHGGSLRVESSEREGTVFEAVIPRQLAATTAAGALDPADHGGAAPAELV